MCLLGFEAVLRASIQLIREVSFDGRPPTPLTTTMNKDYYRQVPNRFFVNQSNTDTCKLEKLTNLFPDMKATIELELFKINNLSRTIDRLSRIYTVLTALDTRDDTLHLFLGPYHLSLGPAMFAALHFKNASSALLIASQSSTFSSSNGNTEAQRRKRRRDAVLRRFRRAVRKLTLVKSIIDQLQPASVLTPYNQYELYTHGIYDLVLSGRIQQSTDSMFINDQFLEQLHEFDTSSNAGERSPLLASNFIKINNLLNLLSSSGQPQLQTQSTIDHNLTTTTTTAPTEKIIRIASSESLTSSTNPNPTNHEALITPSSVCCSQHNPNASNLMYSVRRPMSPQPSQFLTIGTRSRCNSNSNLLKTPSILSRQSTTNSLPDSAAGDGSNSDIPLSTSPQSNPIDTELHTPTNLTVQHPFNSTNLLSSSPSTNEEDALINRVSSLLTDYLLSRSSTTPSIYANHFHEHETNSNLSDSAISLSTSATTSLINPLITSNQSSSSISINDFDQILQRIKTAVDNRLSIETNTKTNIMGPTKNIHQDLSYSPIKTAIINRRQQLLALHAVSCQETHTDDYDNEHSINRRNRFDLTTKSQSFDATHLNSHDVISTTTTPINLDTNNTTYQMSNVQSDDKGVQTDPRIRHARSKLLETLHAYITAVSRYRHHLFKQYAQSNTNYEQHYSTMPELQQYEYRDLINVRKEILNRFEWVINELEQVIESLEARRLTVADAQQRIDVPLVKEVIESSLNADLPTSVDQNHTHTNVRQRPVPSEDEWRMYARDLQDTKEDLYFIDSLVHRGISKIDRLVTFTNLYT